MFPSLKHEHDTTMKKFFCVLLLLTALVSSRAELFSQAKVPVKITGIRSNLGSIRLAVYQNRQQYESNKPALKRIIPKANIHGGTLSIDVDLEYGVYGIAILDDENDNGKMDYGLVLPSEGFGFSNYYLTGLTQPSFENFKIQIKKDDLLTVVVKMKYF